jgi:ActR/RegA family two-component response regulator
MPDNNGKLAGLLILIAEDDGLIAEDLRISIEREGAEVHLATTVVQALMLLDRIAVDGAILDCRLVNDASTAVADALKRRQIPYVVVTGYAAEVLPVELRGAPYLAKPFRSKDLIEMAVCHFRRQDDA